MNLASIWKWGCFRLRNAGTTARAGAGGEGVFFSRWRPIYFIRFIWNGPIHVLLHKYSISNIFFDASNADKSCKYMKQFESYDFKDQRMKKSTRNWQKVFHKDKMEHWNCPENLEFLDSWKAPYMIGAAILKPWTSFSMIYSIVNSLKTDQF